MAEEKIITSIGEYIAAVKDATSSEGVYVYRGQSNCKWELRSAAARRLLNSYNNKENENEIDGFNHLFLRYHENDLIEKAKINGYHREDGRELKDLEVLAKLQHHGAATCLMDFTKNPLFALWFACREEKNDGKVFIINSNNQTKIRNLIHDDLEKSFDDILRFDTRKEDKNNKKEISPERPIKKPLLWRWEPEGFDPRILRQDSVFLFGLPSAPKELTEQIIFIDNGAKESILQELKSSHNINAESLFKDLSGFASVNAHHSPLGELQDAGQYFIRGNHRYQQGQHEEAIKDYDKAIELNPKYAYAYSNRGLAKHSLGKYKEAINDYDEAIDINTNYDAAYYNRGNAKYSLGKYKEAIEDYGKAIELNHEYADAYNNRGAAKVKLEQYKEAIKDFDKAIELNPNYAVAYNNRGNANKKLGRTKEGDEDLKKYIQLTQGKPK